MTLTSQVDVVSDEEEEEDTGLVMVAPSSSHEDRYRPQAFDKLTMLLAFLIEKSRGEDLRLKLSDKDTHALLEGKVSAPVSLSLLYQKLNYVTHLSITFSLLIVLFCSEISKYYTFKNILLCQGECCTCSNCSFHRPLLLWNYGSWISEISAH